MFKARPAITLVEVLVIIAIVGLVVMLLLPMKRGAREAGRRNICQNNLKQIGLALLDYEEDHGSLPPAYTVDDDGNRLHSWRTLILPYMEQKALFDTIDLSKPWDDPANEQARKTVVEVFECPSAVLDPGNTSYLAIVGPDCVFTGSEPRKLTDITDGVAYTMMLVDASPDHAVHWMSPEDCSPGEMLAMLDRDYPPHPEIFLAAFADGHPQQLEETIDRTVLQGLMTIAGQEELGDLW